MASFLSSRAVIAAVCKQSTSLPVSLQKSSQSVVVSPSGKCRSLSSRCLSSRLIASQHSLRSRQLFNSPSIISAQQCRTFLAQLNRQSQTLKENSPSTGSSSANLQLTNLPYFVRRTASNQLPVYLVTKAGGTKQQTKIQKTEGDLDALRNDLAQFLELESGGTGAAKSSDVSINRLTGHIIVKGWRKPEIQKFLLERSF